MIDIANQVTQQNAHKTATCEPYIAAIVGPYNKKLPTCQSSMTWFYVNHEPGRIPSEDENPLQAGCTPMQLQVSLLKLLPLLDAAFCCMTVAMSAIMYLKGVVFLLSCVVFSYSVVND